MTIYTVLLDDGTTGQIDTETLDGQHPSAFVGDWVNIKLQDENGKKIECYGRLVEILEEV